MRLQTVNTQSTAGCCVSLIGYTDRCSVNYPRTDTWSCVYGSPVSLLRVPIKVVTLRPARGINWSHGASGTIHCLSVLDNRSGISGTMVIRGSNYTFTGKIVVRIHPHISWIAPCCISPISALCPMIVANSEVVIGDSRQQGSLRGKVQYNFDQISALTQSWVEQGPNMPVSFVLTWWQSPMS